MVVELIGRGREMTYTHAGWQKVVYLGLRYGWVPAGARRSLRAAGEGAGVPPRGRAEKRPRGFDEATWAFRLDGGRGIPAGHPLAYSSDVLLYCEDPVVNSYFGHGRVGAADALALAAALERSLPHMPEGPDRFADHKPGALFNPMEWFVLENQKHLRGLIAFCKEGAFRLVP